MSDVAADLGLHIGAGDGNRTRTISLGSLWRCPPATCCSVICGDRDDLPVSDRDYPRVLFRSGT
jgi:hypothetical protein